MSHRALQLAGTIRSIVARHALTIPPNVATMVSITEVRLSKDFSYADIAVTALNGIDAALATLRRGATQMREEVGRSITLHKLPLLRFAHDESIERAERVDRLLQTIAKPAERRPRRVSRRKK